MVTGAGLNFSSMQIARAVRRSPIATLGMKSARMTAFAQGVDLRDLRPERARALSIRIPTGARVIHEWQHPSRWSTPGPRSRHTPCQHLLEVSAEIAVRTPSLPVDHIDTSDPFLKMLEARHHCAHKLPWYSHILVHLHILLLCRSLRPSAY
jgi:hypothetical protein